MRLKMDLCGIELQFKVYGYEPSVHEKWDDQWCRCDFSLSSGNWLNYRKVLDEVLLSCEVENIADNLQKLLNDNLTEKTEISFIEPDFQMTLCPKRDLRDDPKYLYVQPGHEIADIHMDWRVYFWSDGLTDNFLSVTLGREDIQILATYLQYVIGKLDASSQEIQDLIAKDFLIGAVEA